MSTAGYYNYDGVWLAASATPLKTIWGSGTSTMTAGSGAEKLASSGQGEKMIGAGGDDTFVVGSVNDTVVAGATGVDTVVAAVDFILPTGVQNLTLNGTWANVVGVGNASANIITADKAGETLIGGGGDDVLVSAGGDTFVFQPGSGKDVIMGFHAGASGADMVRLAGYGFTSFAAVQGAMTQVGSDVVLKLSATDLIDFKNTTVSAFTAGNFQLSVDTAGKAMSFDDEFNSLSLYNPATKTGVWKTSYAWGNQSGLDSHTILSDGEQEVYVDPSFAGAGQAALGLNPFSISNGVLSITAGVTPTADKTALWNYSYTSGLISTEKTFSQTYGYFEIKAEMPSTTTGFWPAFWLMPADGSYSSELDVFEEVGDKANTVYNTVHYFPTGSTTKASTGFSAYVPNMMSGFHTYGVLWSPTTITWYVDGVAVNSVATPAGMNKPMYMVANLAVGGDWPGSPSASTPFPSALQIDYIRAYTLAQVTSGSAPVSGGSSASGGSAPATVAPTEKADAYAAKAGAALSVGAAQGVLANDTDHNGLTLTAVLAANGGPSHGTLVLNADGSFTYTPNAGYAGTDSFTYIAKDSLSSGTPTTVTLTVAAQAPATAAETYGAHAGQALTEDAAHGVLAGVTDPNGLTLTAVLAANGGPSHGTLVLNADGSFTYTPTLGFAGPDSFTYIAKDSLSSGAPTTVTLNVVDPPPVGKADAYAAAGDAALKVAAANGVLANDVAGNGLPLKAALAANGGPAHGTLVLNADGSFTYTPNAGYVGTDSFTYIASDSLSASAPTTVKITVGAQAITGGHGNDVYHVYNSADQISVAAGTPNETVDATVSYALPANIQNLVLQGSGLTGTANSMDDSLTSTGGANTLVGGSGNDTFYVNTVGDKVVVGAVHGNDLIVSSVSYALPDNVRSIQLTGTGLTATANASGGDYLSSVGGGNTLVGSAKGNDSFTVAHTTDVVVVAAGAVNDTINAYVSYALPANVQNLVGKGANALTLTGNSLANVITANSGADTLTGGGGADTFAMAPGEKKETITDFSASDRIDIAAYLAKGLNPSFHDFGTYSTVSFATGETITLLGVHASSLAISGHYVV